MRSVVLQTSTIVRLLWCSVALLVFATSSAPAEAADFSLARLMPTRVFVQAGFGEDNTRAYVAGVIWDWDWRKEYAFGTLTGFSDASFGRWSTEAGEGSTWATQIGLTPVLRFHPTVFKGRGFIEIGIGANVILPLYRSGDKSFSTEFNFGDHIAVGTLLGQRKQHELALRLQHFSNAGIDHPNPGENFVQVRYARRF